MTFSYIGQGGAVAVTTTAAPSHPASMATNDKEILWVFSDGSAIGNANAGDGWVEAGTETSGGGMRCRMWTRDYDGTTPAVSISCTSGTKGEAHIAAIRSDTGSAITVVTGGVATDTNTASTAFSASDGSFTSVTGDWIAESRGILAPSGTYSGNPTSLSIAQAGATVSTTARFAGLTGTSTVAYGMATGNVTSGGTGNASMAATTAGANAAGVAGLILLREGTAPTYVRPKIAVSTAAVVKASVW